MIMGRRSLSKSFKTKKWPLLILNKLLANINQTTVDCKPGSGKKRKTWMFVRFNLAQTTIF